MFQKFGFALEDLEKPIGEFSGGQQTKIALIQLLLLAPGHPASGRADQPPRHRGGGVAGKLSEEL